MCDCDCEPQRGCYYTPRHRQFLTKDEEKELVDLETVMNDTWTEYGTKFVMGKLDPGNDADWNEYLATLKKAGFDTAMAIRGEAVKKSIVY